ncbi:hypothetical protein GUJ93_ZPchr0007g4991 [Zizania palustris]|uniref:Cyclin C-terminal domain-containing protein n=1 Tax=Zizania palustris TaxID=103762 RepID=A0A8J5TJT7_ZIZPA|nr:hypothetical protein GUJ93_ZPchr0007g4991 [Zizania palustris]
MEKMEAETQCFILTRASQAWKPLTEDQAALLDTEKSLLEDHKHLEAKYPTLSLESMGSYLAELSCLLEYDCVRLLPSVVAASAVFVARLTLDPDTNPWT